MPPPLRVVIYRRLMMRIAERIARQHRAQALVTGDVRRPGGVADARESDRDRRRRRRCRSCGRSIGMDKEEITAEAQRLGTYAISIIPDEDCCTLFTPRIRRRRRACRVERAEAALDDRRARRAGGGRRRRGRLQISRDKIDCVRRGNDRSLQGDMT